MSRIETIGNAVLYLGDCREIVPQLPRLDAVVTSPPYNQMTGLMRPPSGTWAQSDFGRAFVNKWQADGYHDDLPECDYQASQNDLFSVIRERCRPSASLFYNHQLRWRNGVMLHPVQWFQPRGFNLRAEIIWDRCGRMMFNARMFCRFDERVLWFTASDQWKWNQASVGDGTIWRIAREQDKEHPVSFPVELPIRCIRSATDAGDLILDPYAGGGTTGVAAVKLGRKFIGIEIEPKYFDIACRRIEEATKQPDMFIERPPEPVQNSLADAWPKSLKPKFTALSDE